jgi:lipopolysaccharide export system permease protein
LLNYTLENGSELLSIERSIPGAGKPLRLMTVLDKMIFFDLFKTVGAILIVLVIIIVSQKFIKILAQAIEGNIANETIFILLGLKTIAVTASFLPAAIFMAVLIVLGRMHHDHEIAAINSAGGGLFRLYRGIFLVLLPLSFCAIGLSFYSAPWSEAKMQQLMHHDRQTADIRGITAGRFSEYSNGELIFYAEKIDSDGKMQDVFVQNQDGNKSGIANADSAHLKFMLGGLYLVLENGEHIVGEIGQRDYAVENFHEYAVLIESHPSELNLNNQSTPTKLLWGSSRREDMAEMQNRLNTPISVLLLGFLAVPLAKSQPRGGIYGSMLIAFGIYFIHGNLQRLNYSWVINGLIPADLGYFWLSGLLLMISLLMLIQANGWRWLVVKTFKRIQK